MSVALDALMAPPSSVDFPLPDGVFRDAKTGNLFFNRLDFRGFYDADDTRLFTPDEVEAARRRGSVIYEDHAEVPVPCVVPPPWAAEDQIEALRRQARLDDKWFWHPTHGWLPWGRKRAAEAPENRGTNSIQRNRRRREVPAPDLSPVLPSMAASPVIDGTPTPVVEPPSEAAVVAQAPRRGRPPLAREELTS